MRVKTPLWICLVAALSGCAHTQPSVSEEKVGTPRAEEVSNGSIWTQGQADYYLDRRARNVGDIVTVKIIEELLAAGV